MTLPETLLLSTTPFEHPALDYERLRREGIAHLERMAGPAWTDFNDHDPGITILEQLCFALTDLAYRIEYALPDLLTRPDGDAATDFFPPQTVLPNEPVTLDDLRRLVLDVPGVRNGWVEAAAIDPPLFYDEVAKGITLHPANDFSNDLPLKGVLRVRFEFDVGARADGRLLTVPEVIAAVTHTLHANRPLGIDFLPVESLTAEPIEVSARIEIGAVDDARALLAEIMRRLADFISPPVRFIPYGEAVQQGIPLETILTGPLLRHGYLDPAELARNQRRHMLHTSDILRELMAISGVEAVTRLEIAAGGAFEAWTLPLNADLVPRLDVANSRLTLVRRGQTVAVSEPTALSSEPAVQPPKSRPLASLFAPPPGRDRQPGRYRSLMHQFPDVYGVNSRGLPASAPAERHAQALQLKGYLLFFDQLLAGLFTQLDHARALLSVRPLAAEATLIRPVVDAELALDEMYRQQGADLEQTLSGLATHSQPPGAAVQQRTRQLDHLLARCGESLADYALAMTGILAGTQEALDRQLLADRQSFLAALPSLAGRRGTGINLLAAGNNQRAAGLVERLQRKLGLTDAEPLILLEHILLRPNRLDDAQQTPLIIPQTGQDPYSLQVSLAFRLGDGRTTHPEFRTFVDRLARAETPAHLAVHIHWLEAETFDSLQQTHGQWLVAQQALRLAALEKFA